MNSLAEAIYETLINDEGLHCPFGCKGCAARMFGLVSHLMGKHGFKEKDAWKLVRSVR